MEQNNQNKRSYDPVVFWISAAAASHAMTYSFFHWGLSAWAIYVLLTIPLAHACYTKKLPFRFSSAFYYVLGDRIYTGHSKV